MRAFTMFVGILASMWFVHTTLASSEEIDPVPTIVGISNISDTGLRVQFQKARASDRSFVVEVSTDQTTWKRAATLNDKRRPPRAKASVAVGGLKPSTEYCFRVFTVLADDRTSGASVSKCATTLGEQPLAAMPSSPKSFGLTREPLFNPTSILLSWTDASTNESGFVVERRRTTGDKAWRSIQQVVYVGDKNGRTTGKVLKYVDDEFEPSTNYCYRVSAWNEGGRSNPSEELCIGIPRRPSDLRLFAVGEDSITAGWNDGSDNEILFDVHYYPEDAGGSGGITTQASENSTSLKLTNLKPDTEYCVRVRSASLAGNSNFTPRECARTKKHVDEPSDQTGIGISIRDPVPGSSPGPCSGTIQYHIQPVSLTGHDGSSAARDFTQDFAVTSTKEGDQQVCYYNRGALGTAGLKAGKWLIAVKAGLWQTSCEAVLDGNENHANFSTFKAGCRQDSKYP